MLDIHIKIVESDNVVNDMKIKWFVNITSGRKSNRKSSILKNSLLHSALSNNTTFLLLTLTFTTEHTNHDRPQTLIEPHVKV